MSDIKLKAASGGGSISLKGPSSAGSDTDFLDTSGNLKVTADAIVDGRVNIGSTGGFDSNGDDLTITNASHGGITIKTGTSSDGIIRFGDGSGAAEYRGWINYKHADDALVFGTSTLERLRIKSDGTIQTNGALDIKIADGNLVMGTAGHGIDFSAVTHADGMTSELLDSYEDGTYTPQILASGGTSGLTPTYTNQVGRYTKIGNIVQFSAEIDYSAKSGVNSNNTAYITISLPFATRSGSWGNTSIQFNTAIEFDEGSNNVHHNDDGAYTYFWSGLDAGRQDYYPRTSNLHSSGGIYIAGTYLVA